MTHCPHCGASEANVIPVWEKPENHENREQPRYLGCKSCHRMVETRLLRAEDDEAPPQMELSDREIEQLPIGNQYPGTPPTLIEYQCIKGAAVYYAVSDWTSKVDATLTKEENVTLMENYGTQNKETTLRETKTQQEYYG